MWLLPALHPLCRLIGHLYYRFRVVGGAVPASGPLLLAANHPNALLDPALVVAAAGRSVRFLAKSTLFADRRVGWLARAGGGIPVYRRADDPLAVGQNVEAFAAAFQALAEDAAVGIFPEGISHSHPSLAELKTGTARIALGAYPQVHRAFPILPIGLVLREKDVYRSAALAVVGEPIEWEDLAPRGAEDREAVRELTARLDTALRRVTVNLESWEDLPLVESAQEIWAAEQGEPPGAEARLARIEATTAILARLRQLGKGPWWDLAREVGAHRTRIDRLGLRPADLAAEPGLSAALRWTARRLHLLVPPALALAAVGHLLFWPPFRLTALLTDAARPTDDLRSTYKALGGIVIYAAWVLLLVLIGGWLGGWLAALSALVMVPTIGLSGLWVRERWRRAREDVGRFFLLRSRRDLVAGLRRRQQGLARRLEELHQSWRRGEMEATGNLADDGVLVTGRPAPPD